MEISNHQHSAKLNAYSFKKMVIDHSNFVFQVMTPKEGHANIIFGMQPEKVEHHTIFHSQCNHEYS